MCFGFHPSWAIPNVNVVAVATGDRRINLAQPHAPFSGIAVPEERREVFDGVVIVRPHKQSRTDVRQTKSPEPRAQRPATKPARTLPPRLSIKKYGAHRSRGIQRADGQHDTRSSLPRTKQESPVTMDLVDAQNAWPQQRQASGSVRMKEEGPSPKVESVDRGRPVESRGGVPTATQLCRRSTESQPQDPPGAPASDRLTPLAARVLDDAGARAAVESLIADARSGAFMAGKLVEVCYPESAGWRTPADPRPARARNSPVSPFSRDWDPSSWATSYYEETMRRRSRFLGVVIEVPQWLTDRKRKVGMMRPGEANPRQSPRSLPSADTNASHSRAERNDEQPRQGVPARAQRASRVHSNSRHSSPTVKAEQGLAARPAATYSDDVLAQIQAHLTAAGAWDQLVAYSATCDSPTYAPARIMQFCPPGSAGEETRADSLPASEPGRVQRDEIPREWAEWLVGYPKEIYGYVCRWSRARSQIEVWVPCAEDGCAQHAQPGHHSHGVWISSPFVTPAT
ncbi:hypothetical protein C8Q76DRAFT_800826 [Earliella scabrosa]|nr:hypothetical protein C8Q76DRAFT_800826 [Earliella scabrosa]